jgi:imidazolonepropionase-like amidohydrolase
MSAKSTAFVGVNVVPMNENIVLRNQTVVVEGHQIKKVGPAEEITLPRGTNQIANCAGKYLMPGLCDMHVHNWTETEFTLFLANGVTTIRNMWGSPRHLGWRDKISRGEILGPTIYTTGPLIDGSPPIWSSCKVITDPGEVVQEISNEKHLGYDFVKVYNRLTSEVYEAIASEAKKDGIRFVGHVPYAVGLKRAIEVGQSSIEHLNGYIDAFQNADSPFRSSNDPESRLGAVEYADESKIAPIGELTVKSGVWNCVTLVVFQRALAPTQIKKKFVDEDLMKYVPPIWMESWKAFLEAPSQSKIPEESILKLSEKREKLMFRLTGLLHKEGAPILLGTDTPNPFVIPGFSIHEELRNLVNAGFSPYETIKAGTSDAAKFLNAEDEFGTIEAGKRADLILLDANPIDDVTFLATKRLGVMVRGVWLEESLLQTKLENILQSYHSRATLHDVRQSSQHTEGRMESSFLYDINVGSFPLGQEEVTLTHGSVVGSMTIKSRVVLNAPPFVDYFETLIEADNSGFHRFRFRAERSEGTSQVEIEKAEHILKFREFVAGLPSELSWSRQLEEKMLLAGPTSFVGTYFQVGKELLLMKQEESKNWDLISIDADLGLELSNSKFQIGVSREKEGERKERSLGREYTISDKRSNGSYEGKIVVDDRGVPLTLQGPSLLYGLNHRLVSNKP